jgi:hypothetical protein
MILFSSVLEFQLLHLNVDLFDCNSLKCLGQKTKPSLSWRLAVFHISSSVFMSSTCIYIIKFQLSSVICVPVQRIFRRDSSKRRRIHFQSRPAAECRELCAGQLISTHDRSIRYSEIATIFKSFLRAGPQCEARVIQCARFISNS